MDDICRPQIITQMASVQTKGTIADLNVKKRLHWYYQLTREPKSMKRMQKVNLQDPKLGYGHDSLFLFLLPQSPPFAFIS